MYGILPSASRTTGAHSSCIASDCARMAAVLAGMNWAYPYEKIPPHNWDGHDFGPPPAITDRLFQGPFSNYGPDANAPGSVVMATTPFSGPVPNYGMGLVTYLCDEVGPTRVKGETLRESMEKLSSC